MYQAIIVDDEPYIVEGIREAIDWEGFGFELTLTSTNPLHVLEYLHTHPVHLLITDISMPEMDGITLIREAKAILPLLSVIVLSAYDNFVYVKGALRYGAENYLLKPLEPDDLADSVRSAVTHMQEREILSLNYGGTMLTFRSTFVEQWIRNILPPEALLERARLLGINLEADNYTAVIFTAAGQDPMVMSRFFEMLLALIPGRALAHFYFETPFRLVCIFSGLSADENVEQLLHGLYIPGENTACIYICMGQSVPFYQSVFESYNQARQLLFLMYTGIPFASPGDLLDTAVSAFLSKLLADNNIPAFRLEADRLYRKHPAFSCTVTLVSCLIRSLTPEPDSLTEGSPALTQLLASFPDACASAACHREFTEHMIDEYTARRDTASQSMFPCVNAVIRSINEFQDKDISLKTLAAHLNVTPSYLGTVFKQQTGYYFNDYLTEARIQYAARLIETTDMKMKDIVDRVGFSSQTYFNRMFKRFFEVSPVTYRRDRKLHT